MSDDEVGYCKPPRHTRFQKGVCPNPLGRGARKDKLFSEALASFHNQAIAFTESGRTRRAPRSQVTVQRHIASALNGSIQAVGLLLSLWQYAKKDASGIDQITVFIEGGLPVSDSRADT